MGDLVESSFLFISKSTPLVNVDLLIKNSKNETLLSWRNDKYCGTGWHIPGGIIRFKERLEQRIIEVGKLEIGIDNIKFDKNPLAINQLILDQDIRGHFISFLFSCYLPDNFIINNNKLKENDVGFLKWFKDCPSNFLEAQNIYKNFF